MGYSQYAPMEPAIASPFTDESRPSADGRSVIRQSHDEPNLAEFPLVLLTTQSPKDRHTLEYQDIERHPRTGVTITRKVTITGAGKFGLPTSRDEDVLMALTYLTLEDKSKTGFDDPMVYFTRRKLLEILDWPDTGHYYKRLKEALTRWKGVNIYYENWWDNLAQDYVPETEGFSILDNFKLSDARRKDHSQLILPLDDNQHKQSLCYIKWNMTPFAGFKNGNLRTLDLDKFFSLPTAAAKRAYRYLNLRLPDSGHQEFDLRTFAFQHVGFSENYKPGRLRNQVQETIVAPLEQTEFIEKMPPKRRFLKQNGRDRIVFARKASANLSASRPDQTPLLQQDCPPAPSVTACPALSPLINELTRRHLGGKLATKFVEAYPADYIQQKIDYFDFTLTVQSIKNPAGWLRKAIEEDYGMPPNYLPREERERQAAAARQAEQRTAEARRHDVETRRHEQEQHARQRATRQKVDAYLKQLDQAERIALEAEALAAASPADRESYESDIMARFRDTLMHGMISAYLTGRPELEQIAVEA